MLGEIIKQKFEKTVGPRLLKLKVSATMLTLIGGVFALIAGYFLFKGLLVLGGVFILLNYLFDGIDGIVARATKTTSNVGFILDHTFDFVLRRIWYFALAYAGFISYDIVALAIFSLAASVLLSDLVKIKSLKFPRYSGAWADWLIIPAVFINVLVIN